MLTPSPHPAPDGTPPVPAPPAHLPPTPAPRWHSEELLRHTDEALIVHSDQVYRLRRTGTGKLILTK